MLFKQGQDGLEIIVPAAGQILGAKNRAIELFQPFDLPRGHFGRLVIVKGNDIRVIQHILGNAGQRIRLQPVTPDESTPNSGGQGLGRVNLASPGKHFAEQVKDTVIFVGKFGIGIKTIRVFGDNSLIV